MFKCKRWKSILVLGISRIVQKNHKSENNPRIENRKYCTLCSVCGLTLPQGMFTCGIQWERRCQVLKSTHLTPLTEVESKVFKVNQEIPPVRTTFFSGLSSCPVVVQSLSCVRLSATPWTAACQASLSFPELAQTHVY